MIRIGLLSDTHGYLDGKVFQYFAACDEVWHAGDIGDASVADALEMFKPLRAVYGNIDDRAMQARFPEDLRFACEDLEVWITHIGGTPPRYNGRVKKILREGPPGLFICGHSHILRVARDEHLGNMVFMNPGAAGNQGFHHTKTIMRFEVDGKKINNLEVIELGKRGEVRPPDE